MKYAALPLVISSLAFLHPDGAAAQSSSFEVTYDPTSHVYLIEDDNDELRHMIYGDGSVDSVDPNLSPFDFRKPVGIGFSFAESPQVVRLPGQVGVMVDGQGFYTLGANGHHAVRNIYQSAELPCERLDPRDFCVLYRASENSGHHFAMYYHRSLGFQFAHWNGTAYEAPAGPLAALSIDEDGFDLTSSERYSKLLPIGTLGSFVVTRNYASASEPAPLSLLTDGGRQPIDLPWPAQFSSAQMHSFRAVGSDVFALATTYVQSSNKPLAFRIREVSGAGAVEDLSAILGSDVNLRWLDIDAAGNAYAIRSSDNRLISYGLVDRQVKDIIECPSATPQLGFYGSARPITLHSSTVETGVWAICGNSLIGLRDGAVVTTVALREGISKAHLASTVGQPVNALVSFSDGSFERLNDGARVRVESLGVFASGTASSVSTTVQWEDGQRICQRRSGSSQGQSRNYVECLDRGAWRETAYAIEAPSDVYESGSYTWALSQVSGATRLSRRARSRQADWETIVDLPATPLYQSPQFVPSSSNDEVGLHIPTIGLYRFSATTGLMQIPIDVTALSMSQRPALSGGWLYAFCKVDGSTPGPNAKIEACAFDAAGQRTSLGEYPESAFYGSATKGFVPLARGALFDTVEKVPDSDNSKHLPIVVFQNRRTPLATLFGEFRYSTTRPWGLSIWSSPDGGAFILKSDEFVMGSSDDLYDRAYRFDGRRLDSLASFSQLQDDSFSSSSTGSSMSWTRLAQIWRGEGGVWRGSAKTGSVLPIRTDMSPANLMIDYSNGANFGYVRTSQSPSRLRPHENKRL